MQLPRIDLAAKHTMRILTRTKFSMMESFVPLGRGDKRIAELERLMRD